MHFSRASTPNLGPNCYSALLPVLWGQHSQQVSRQAFIGLLAGANKPNMFKDWIESHLRLEIAGARLQPGTAQLLY